MKAVLLVLGTLFSFSAWAAPSKIQKVIEASQQFKDLQKQYEDMGGSYKCVQYKVVSTTDLKASLSGYKMVAKSVIARCYADPNDDLDPIQKRLLAFVTETTNAEDSSVTIKVETLSSVTPPQPD